jgi:hypothetical protein
VDIATILRGSSGTPRCGHGREVGIVADHNASIAFLILTAKEGRKSVSTRRIPRFRDEGPLPCFALQAPWL